MASLILTACAGGDDGATDTTAAGDTVSAVSVAESLYVGTWNGRSYRTDTDSGTPWTMVVASADTGLTGTLRFAAAGEEIPVRVTEATESALKSEFGPYRTPTAANAEVVTTTEAKIDGDSLHGTFIATPTAGGEPFRGRFSARRAQ